MLYEVITNSFSQLEQHRAACEKAGVSYGIRVNPECSTQEGQVILSGSVPDIGKNNNISNFFSVKSSEIIDKKWFTVVARKDFDIVITSYSIHYTKLYECTSCPCYIGFP